MITKEFDTFDITLNEEGDMKITTRVSPEEVINSVADISEVIVEIEARTGCNIYSFLKKLVETV